MSDFIAVGKNVLVELLNKSKEDQLETSGGFVLVDTGKEYFSKGRVISPPPEGSGSDLIDEGDVVLYLTDMARKVGNGLPDNLYLVNVEDVHLIIDSE